MSDLSRPGYTNRRSPGAMGAAILLNASVVALIIAVPVTVDHFSVPPPLIIHDVRSAPPPPEVDEQRLDPTPKSIGTPIDRADPPKPIAIETPFDQIAKDLEIATYSPPSGLGDGAATKQADPPTPLFIKARPDPRFAEAFHPDYPPSLVRQGLEGDVTVRITIDPRGRVTAVEMVKASNPAFFAETKRQALRSWRFVPATRDGMTIESVQTMTVYFRLEE